MQHVELHLRAGGETADRTSEFTGVLDRLAVDRLDDIAGFNAGLGSRAVGLRFGNERTFRLLQPEAFGNIRRHRLNLDANPAAADAALVLELSNDALDGRCGDRECDAHAAAGRRIDRGIDAHHLALGVEGRATGVALVNGRVDLNEIVVGAIADIAAPGRNDTSRDRAAETER